MMGTALSTSVETQLRFRGLPSSFRIGVGIAGGRLALCVSFGFVCIGSAFVQTRLSSSILFMATHHVC